jgi:uncharacterized protein
MKPRRRNFFVNIYRKARISFLKIYYSRGSVHEIALGAGIGAFLGVFPTFGLSTIISLLLYKLFRFNLVAAISGAFISNPLTSPFLLLISFEVGTWLFPTDIQFDMDHWDRDLSQIGLVLFSGATLVSLVAGVAVYFLLRFAIERRRRIAAAAVAAKAP